MESTLKREDPLPHFQPTTPRICPVNAIRNPDCANAVFYYRFVAKMEFKFNVNDIFKAEVAVIRNNLVPDGFVGDYRARA